MKTLIIAFCILVCWGCGKAEESKLDPWDSDAPYIKLLETEEEIFYPGDPGSIVRWKATDSVATWSDDGDIIDWTTGDPTITFFDDALTSSFVNDETLDMGGISAFAQDPIEITLCDPTADVVIGIWDYEKKTFILYKDALEKAGYRVEIVGGKNEKATNHYKGKSTGINSFN